MMKARGIKGGRGGQILLILWLIATSASMPSMAQGDTALATKDGLVEVVLGPDWHKIMDSDRLSAHRSRKDFVAAAELRVEQTTRAIAVLTVSVPEDAPRLSANRDALERHLQESVAAMVTVDGVRDVAFSVVAGVDDANVGLIEARRGDQGLALALGLSPLGEGASVAQISFVLPSESGLVQVFVYLSSDDVELRDTLEVALPARLKAPPLIVPEPMGRPRGGSLATPLLIVLGVSLIFVVGLRVHMVTRRRTLRKRARTSGLAPASGVGSLEAKGTPLTQWEGELDSLEGLGSNEKQDEGDQEPE